MKQININKLSEFPPSGHSSLKTDTKQNKSKLTHFLKILDQWPYIIVISK